jgi:hypothetical protein
MKKSLRLLFATVALWCVAAGPATAEPIAITSGMISLPKLFAGGPMTLAGTDGVRPFTFDGVLSGADAGIDAFGCSPCLPDATQISVAIHAFSAIFGTVVYGSETYLTNGAFSESKGALPLVIAGTSLLPPAPTAVGVTATLMVPFTAIGFLVPPAIPPGGLGNSILGSGVVAITLVGDPGNGDHPVWAFQSAQYRFGEQAPIPEPTSVLLLITGLAGLALRHRGGGVGRHRSSRPLP